MNTPVFITFLLMISIGLSSYRGFKDQVFFLRYRFQVDQVKAYKDYKRLFTSGFLHVGWMHLIFNLVALYFFGASLEASQGPFEFLLLFAAGLAGGNLLSMIIHKNNPVYSSVGASGAVTGLIFSAIALTPGMQISFFLIPIPFPGWLFGLAIVLLSIYGIRSKRDNIGHESHLGGALSGMLVAILLHPSSLVNNLPTILIIALPAIAFIILIVKQPGILLIDNLFFRQNRRLTVEDRYNIKKRNKQQELDMVLEKIHKKGIKSLSKKEKELLEELSR